MEFEENKEKFEGKTQGIFYSGKNSLKYNAKLRFVTSVTKLYEVF